MWTWSAQTPRRELYSNVPLVDFFERIMDTVERDDRLQWLVDLTFELTEELIEKTKPPDD